jgi:hypothetical protein
MAHKRSKAQNAAIHAKGGLTAYDVKAKQKVNIVDPHAVQIGKANRKMWAIKGKSSKTGITVFRIVGKKKPTL